MATAYAEVSDIERTNNPHPRKSATPPPMRATHGARAARAKVAHPEPNPGYVPSFVSNASKGVVVMRPKNGWDTLQHEILEEQAATSGRLGCDLRDALDTLDAIKKEASGTRAAVLPCNGIAPTGLDDEARP